MIGRNALWTSEILSSRANAPNVLVDKKLGAAIERSLTP